MLVFKYLFNQLAPLWDFCLNKTKLKLFLKNIFFLFFYWKKVPEILNFNVSHQLTSPSPTPVTIFWNFFFLYLFLWSFKYFLMQAKHAEIVLKTLYSRFELIWFAWAWFAAIGFTLANATQVMVWTWLLYLTSIDEIHTKKKNKPSLLM